jgi:hypothetical protein
MRCLQGLTPLEDGVGPEGVVLPAPTISQGSNLGHGGEKVGDQELVPKEAVE